MSGESPGFRAGSRWRDFLNRREPGARWMLLVLVLAAAAEVWMMLAFRERFFNWPAPVHYWSLFMAAVALLTMRWWSLPSAPAFPDPKWEVPAASRRWVWLMAGAIAILAVWPRSARLNHSLTDSEVQQLVWTGQHEDLVQGHVAAEFASDALGQQLPGRQFSERIIRTLPWAAGFLTTGLLVLLGAALGSPRAGLGAGLMLALHPGHVRWSSELADRAHSLLLFVAALLCLLCALRTNRWRWWAALAACEAATMFGNFGNVLWLLTLNGSGVLILVFSEASRRDRISNAFRMVLALAVAGVVMPVPFTYVIEPFTAPPVPADVWARVIAGVPWHASAVAEGGGCDIAGTVRESAWRGPVFWGLFPLCAVAGLAFMFWQDWRTRLAGLAAVVVSVLSPMAAIFFFPLLAAWAGAGLLRLFPGQRRLLHAPVFIAVIYVVATTPVLQRMMQLPRQPLRDAAITARRSAAETGATAFFGDKAGYARFYDPGVHELPDVAALDKLIDVAYEKNLPLLVYRMNAAALDAEWSALNAKLTKSGQFHLVKEFAAFDPRFGYELYRYQPREQIINIELKPEEKK